MKYIVQLTLMMFGIAVICLLQFQYWFGETGSGNSAKLVESIQDQQALLDKQAEINRILTEDVKDLKLGLDAIEEHARLDLGYIKPDETFVQMSSFETAPSSNIKTKKKQKYVESIPEPYIPVE